MSYQYIRKRTRFWGFHFCYIGNECDRRRGSKDATRPFCIEGVNVKHNWKWKGTDHDKEEKMDETKGCRLKSVEMCTLHSARNARGRPRSFPVVTDKPAAVWIWQRQNKKFTNWNWINPLKTTGKVTSRRQTGNGGNPEGTQALCKTRNFCI